MPNKAAEYGEYVVALTAIIVSGFLVSNDKLETSVFSSLVTLCLGYVFGKGVVSASTNGEKK